MISSPRPSRDPSLPLSPSAPAEDPALQLPPGMNAKYLICSKAFKRRADLTRHAAAHAALLSQSFPCPACGETTSTLSQWSNHAEQQHGKQYAPNFPTELLFRGGGLEHARSPGMARLACSQTMPMQAFLGHVSSQYAGDPAAVAKGPDCPGVSGLGVEGEVVHLAEQHRLPPGERCFFCAGFFSARGMARHVRRSYFHSYAMPTHCPTCQQRDGSIVTLEDYDAWRLHVLRTGHVVTERSEVPLPRSVLAV